MTDTADTSTPIVITVDNSHCTDVCYAGDVKVVPPPALQERLAGLSPEDRKEVLNAYEALTHNFMASIGQLTLLLDHGIDTFTNGALALQDNVIRSVQLVDTLVALGPLVKYAQIHQI